MAKDQAFLDRRRLRPWFPAPGSRPAAPHSAPLAPTAAAQGLATATFIFLNDSARKAKAKPAERRDRARARGERGVQAGRQGRGPRASGLRAAGRAAFGPEPRPPERTLAHLPAAPASAGPGAGCRGPGGRAASGEARGVSAGRGGFPHLPRSQRLLGPRGWQPARDLTAGGASWASDLRGRVLAGAGN